MKYKTYYILRHSHTKETKFKKHYKKDNFKAPILKEEREPIFRIANFLKTIPTDYHVSSSYVRCKQTARIIESILGKKFVLDKRLNEYEYEDPFESFRKRVRDFLADLGKSVHQHIVICTHGAVIAALKYFIVGDKFEYKDALDYPDPGVLTIIENRRMREIDFRL